MNILIINDDGINSEAMWIMRDYASLLTTNVYVVAPKSDYSGYSFTRLGLASKLKVTKVSESAYAVEGTPVDAVTFAFEYLTNSKNIPFDLVISGINTVVNIPDSSIFSSGTFAAAYIASSVYEVPSLAVSLNRKLSEREASPPNYSTAARVAIEFATTIINQKLPKICYNLIVPNIKYDLIKDTRIVPFIPGVYIDATIDEEPEMTFSYKKGTTLSIDDYSVYITPFAIDITDYDAIKLLVEESGNDENPAH
ncbi:MAG: 5'/3'-nucleotidase SurE [candidate division WOR-3 bacterium]